MYLTLPPKYKLDDNRKTNIDTFEFFFVVNHKLMTATAMAYYIYTAGYIATTMAYYIYTAGYIATTMAYYIYTAGYIVFLR